MNDDRPSTRSIVLSVLALVLALLGLIALEDSNPLPDGLEASWMQ